MKDLSVSCCACGQTVFNEAIFVWAGKVMEAFCGSKCLLKYIQEKVGAKKRVASSKQPSEKKSA